jgi:hypothetical protein
MPGFSKKSEEVIVVKTGRREDGKAGRGRYLIMIF